LASGEPELRGAEILLRSHPVLFPGIGKEDRVRRENIALKIRPKQKEPRLPAGAFCFLKNRMRDY
jgi:hypothetical protein